MRTLGWLAIWTGLCLTLVAGTSSAPRAEPAASSAETEAATADHETASLRGKIVWLGEALARKYGIEHDQRDDKSAVALETEDGRLVPLVKDSRGRGFWLDERLHGVEMELFVRQRPGMPWAQVIRVYSLHDGEKFELEYWCDICAIPMFELKPCECCQGETRLRERTADGSEREAK